MGKIKIVLLVLFGCADPEGQTVITEIGDSELTLRFEGTLHAVTGDGVPLEEELVLDGLSVGPFRLFEVETTSWTDESLGSGLRTVLQGEAMGPNGVTVRETLTVDFYTAYPGAAVLQRIYTAKSSATVDAVVAARITVDGKNEPLRLSIGPAAEIAYKDEEYISIPAVAGYQKSGDMLEGGVPMVDVWTKTGGLALGHIEPRNEAVELPVEVLEDDAVELALTKNPRKEFQEPTNLPITSVRAVLIQHEGDYFEPLSKLSQMVSAQLDKPIFHNETPRGTYEPYWKTWGLPNKVSWTKEDVLEAAAELTEVGISWIELDYGWFETEGKWFPDPEKFSSEADFTDFIATLKAMGFRVGLWWAPLQLDPELEDPKLVDAVVIDEDGDLVVDDDDLYNLSPSDPIVQEFVRETAQRLIGYGADHLYLDSQEVQLFARPDFETAHTGDDGPLASFRALPDIYRIIAEEAENAGGDVDVIVETCPDGRSHSLLHMPYAGLENNGDPGSDRQVREETKWLKALRGPTAAVGDGYLGPYSDSNTTGDPANSVGVGAQLTTLRTVPSTLDQSEWAAWIERYRELGLAFGEYLNLYDIGFDQPEGHVIRKGSTLYYAFYVRTDGVRLCVGDPCEEPNVPEIVEDAEEAWSGPIELRGLQPGVSYVITDYVAEKINETKKAAQDGTIRIDAAFERNLSLEVRESP